MAKTTADTDHRRSTRLAQASASPNPQEEDAASDEMEDADDEMEASGTSSNSTNKVMDIRSVM